MPPRQAAPCGRGRDAHWQGRVGSARRVGHAAASRLHGGGGFRQDAPRAPAPPAAGADSRCLGTEAYPFGGARVWQNTQVRTALLALAGWRAVYGRLAPPERLAEESRRRVPPETRAKRPTLAPIEGQRGTLRQGRARLIDSDAEGRLETHAFKPRLTHLRHRIVPLETPCQQLAEAAARQTKRHRIIGRLADFASQVHAGLAAADGRRPRERIRTLVTRVEVAPAHVTIVCRVAPDPGDPSPA
jgi:site-specific DNA recombinase